jgi:dihydrofolate reductase
MGALVFAINLTLDGCIDHREGVADEETHAWYTRLLDQYGTLLWGRVTYELMEAYWPAVARGEVAAPPAMRQFAHRLEEMPKYVASTQRSEFPWSNSHLLVGDLPEAVQRLYEGALRAKRALELRGAGERGAGGVPERG